MDGARKLEVARCEFIERAASVLRNRINPEDLSDDPRLISAERFIVAHMALDATPVKSRELLSAEDHIRYWAVIDVLARNAHRLPGLLD